VREAQARSRPASTAFRKQEARLNQHLIMGTTRGFRSSGLKYALPLFAAVAVGGPAAAAGPADGPFTEESKLDKAQAGFDRIKIGKLDVTALSDGSGGFFVLNVLAEPKRAEAEKLMARSWVKQPVGYVGQRLLDQSPGPHNSRGHRDG